MKILSARFKGLIGVCRASGLHEIFIDFRKCKHNIILIIGKNGSGKSTIEDALHPFPDPQSKYLPKEDGFKEIEYLTDDGILYKIRIEYPVNKSLERTTTKAFIQKIVDGVATELNSNGNIGSYKDVLYSEFKLDANFISLSQLSVENRGLVDMTPSERKKFVGNIVNSIEVYNNIYKTLNKRSSVFKSMMNTIVAKIDTIGNREALQNTLSSIDLRIHSLEEQKDQLVKELSNAETRIQMSDPNGMIQQNYTKIYEQIESIKGQIKTIDLFINNIRDKSLSLIDMTKESFEKKELELQLEISQIEATLFAEESKLHNLLLEREDESKSINMKINRLNSLKSESDYEEIKTQIDTIKTNIKYYLSEFEKIGLSPETAISKEEFEIGLNTLKEIKEQIDIIRSYNYTNEVEDAIDYINSGLNIAQIYDKIEQDITNCKTRIITVNENIKFNEGLLDRISILDSRPKTCKDDTCSFIVDSIQAKLKNPQSQIDTLNDEMNQLRSELRRYEDMASKHKRITNVSYNIQIILRYVQNNQSILSKLPYNYNQAYFIAGILNGDTFNEIDRIYPSINSANILEYYKRDTNVLLKLESEYKILESKSVLFDEIQKDIDDTTEKLNVTMDKMTQSQQSIFDYKTQLVEIKQLLDKITSIKEKYQTKELLSSTEKDLTKQLDTITDSMLVIEQCVKNINYLNSSIINLKNDLNPLMGERDKIKYSLDRLDEYESELKLYQDKYDTIELIKKYSSPSKAGIQSLFINVYMGQTLTMANDLLSMLFDGELELKKYIIDEKEFRIPCKSWESPIINDDISSCSTAQRCMISMILSFVLLQQGSTKYNILRLDEIDGGLDQENRSKFLSVLQRIMDILNVQNCIMISHSSETVLDSADIILLNPVDKDTPEGNIIFTYENAI